MAKVNIEAAQYVEISKKIPCEKPLLVSVLQALPPMPPPASSLSCFRC